MKRLPAFLAVVVAVFCLCGRTAAQEFRALWVDCEGRNRTLGSKAKIVEMLEMAKRIGPTDVISQVYRGIDRPFSA